MKLTAKLLKGQTVIRTVALSPDHRRVKNEFSARDWISYILINSGDQLTVKISDSQRALVDISLSPGTKNNRTVFHGKIDKGDFFAHANLSEGYGASWGLTVSVMFRKKPQKPVQTIEVKADEIFDLGDGI